MDKTVDSSTSAGVGTDFENLTNNLNQDEVKGATVTRVILDLVYDISGVGTIDSLGIGLVVLNTDAIAVSAFPDPEDTFDQPGWLWRTVHEVFQTDNPKFRQHLDLRAQRKFGGEESNLVLLMKNAGVNTISIHGFARTLIRRP